uniref:Bile acid-CoA:amino acid N-acyltransferase-like n=1 Tax=Seriola lalandi dorsalis TaxID=1841481 RepID=A0A3B4WQK5_SERLL
KKRYSMKYITQQYIFLLPAGAVRWRSSYRPAPLLTAAPARALIDEQISIKGRFLPPHCPVTVCARMHSEDDDLWEAFAHYNTNADGTVNLTKDHSVGGSYLGCEPMGLFWGLQPAPGAREGLRLRKKNVEIPYVVHMSLLEGHVSPGEGQSTELAAVTTERWYTAPGVKRIKIRQNGIVGTLFLPPGPGPFPAMLDLWGMGGALVEYRSALFASRGYASLSIAYIGHKELPGPQNRINVGASYFNSAFDLLRDHRQVCADRVGIIGLSFGVYLALRIATETGAKVRQKVQCLFLNLQLDQYIIEETLRAADKSQLFTRLSYPGAGHLIEPPYSPNSRISLWSVKPKKLITLWGGHLAPHAAAQEDAWKKILDFMENNLRR